MFKKIIGRIKEVMYNLGLIKGISKATAHKDVPVDETYYTNYIGMWQSIYRGRYDPWHKVKEMTLNGQKTRYMNSMKMAKVISSEMANLVFNEKCSISIGGDGVAAEENQDTDPFEDAVQEVLRKNGFYDNFQNHLEYMFALGGSVLKGYYKDGRIRISYVSADCFIPLSDNGREVTEGIFVNESRKGNKHYTLLEWHEWEVQDSENGEQENVYVVTNELYKSDSSQELGIKVDLAELYPDVEPSVEFRGLKRSLFTYMKPNIANNIEPSSHLGVSIFSDALDTLKTLDTMFDSFEREFRLGKTRITVPHTAIKTIADRDTGDLIRYFDPDDEVYEAFKMDDAADQKIEAHQIELRVEEHIEAINAVLTILATQTGFSAGAFTFDSEGLKTATEVISENSKTFRTRAGHITIIEEAISNLVNIIADLGIAYEVEGWEAIVPDEYEVQVNFDDSISEDRETNAKYWIELVNAEVASKLIAIQKIHKVSEEDAMAMIQQIKEEKARQMPPDPDDMFGGAE